MTLIGIVFLCIFGILIIVPLMFIVIKPLYLSNRIINSEFPANEEIDHIAIITVVYSGKYFFKNLFVRLSGIEILTKGLDELKESYIVYRCSSPQRFQEIINKNNTKRIWIFSHGLKHGVGFGKEILYYCEVGEQYKETGLPPKEYIKQLHCNHYGGKSLADYLCDSKEKSFVTDNTRNVKDNRKYIKEFIQDLKKKRLIEKNNN